MRTVLVTGGAGFIGSHLVDHLLEEGASVRVLDNLSTGSLQNLHAAAQRHSRTSDGAGGVSNGSRLEVIVGDVRDRELLRTALCNVKYVFHLAGLPPRAVSATSPGDIHAVNVEGTLNVLQGALTEGVWRVVIGSSAAVYGGSERSPLSEDMAVRPGTLFGASKAAAETYARAFYLRHQLDTVTLRYFSVYGPRQTTTGEGAMIAKVLQAVRQGRGVAEQDERSAEDVLYVGDAVAAALAAARAPRASGHVINIGSGELATVNDVVGVLTDLLGTGLSPVKGRDSAAQPRHVYAQTSMAAELLEFTGRVSLSAGLERTIRSLNEAEYTEGPAYARAGLDG